MTLLDSTSEKKTLTNCGFGEIPTSQQQKIKAQRERIHFIALSILVSVVKFFLAPIRCAASLSRLSLPPALQVGFHAAYLDNFLARLTKVRDPLSPTTDLDKEIRSQQGAHVSVGDWTTDNSVLVTSSAQETNEWKLKLIQQANHSVEISGSICGGQVFREALEAIEKRIEANPHFQAHVLTTSDLLEKEDKALLKSLRDMYPENFHCFETPTSFDTGLYRKENHVKVMIVDEKYYIVGGTNYQDRLSQESLDNKPKNYLDHVLGTGSSDMDIVGRGQVLSQTLRREFFKLYALLEQKKEGFPELKNHYKPLPSEGQACIAAFDDHPQVDHQVEIKAIASGGETKKNAHVKELSRLIKTSDKTITVAQMYFHPQTKIRQALKKQALKDVPIKVITAGTLKETPLANKFYAYANQKHYSQLLSLSNKVKAFVYSNGKNIFHKKVAVFEKEGESAQTVIGSFNWGGKSHKDYELSLAIKNDKVAQRVFTVLHQDKDKLKRVRKQPSYISYALGSVQDVLFPHLIG